MRQFRSYFLYPLAAIACLFCMSYSATAAPPDPDFRYQVHDAVYISSIALPDFAAIAVAHDQAAIAAEERSNGADLITFTQPGTGVIKPDYHESYDTNGLNFIETRLRC
jgi:hypothetical protein